ncbi:MAG: hypothetical protein RIS79_2646 [Verrucomicrobiota bacterium]
MMNGGRRLGIVLLLELVLGGSAYRTHGKRGRERRDVVKVAAGRVARSGRLTWEWAGVEVGGNAIPPSVSEGQSKAAGTCHEM